MTVISVLMLNKTLKQTQPLSISIGDETARRACDVRIGLFVATNDVLLRNENRTISGSVFESVKLIFSCNVSVRPDSLGFFLAAKF